MPGRAFGVGGCFRDATVALTERTRRAGVLGSSRRPPVLSRVPSSDRTPEDPWTDLSFTDSPGQTPTAMSLQRKIDLLRAAQDIQSEGAKDANALAFMARMLVLATLPHSNPGPVPQFSRTNGHYKLVIQPGPDVGIPYGSYPRLVLAWVTSEAVRTKSPEIQLGDSLSAFMGELGLTPTGGRWGTITRLREQMKRLFSARVSAVYEDTDRFRFSSLQIASEVDLWWDPKKPEQAAVFGSSVQLTDPFFEEIVRRPVPIDMRALRALKKSPLGLDLYQWLTYRLSYLKEPTEIAWTSLHKQFGANYSRVRNFTQAVKRELGKIETVWPALRYETPRGRLRLYPCPPHVARVESASERTELPGEQTGSSNDAGA